jgi:hypothetical protein
LGLLTRVEMGRIRMSASVRSELDEVRAVGLLPVDHDPVLTAQFRVHPCAAEETEKWAKVIRAANIKAE